MLACRKHLVWHCQHTKSKASPCSQHASRVKLSNQNLFLLILPGRCKPEILPHASSLGCCHSNVAVFHHHTAAKQVYNLWASLCGHLLALFSSSNVAMGVPCCKFFKSPAPSAMLLCTRLPRTILEPEPSDCFLMLSALCFMLCKLANVVKKVCTALPGMPPCTAFRKGGSHQPACWSLHHIVCLGQICNTPPCYEGKLGIAMSIP